MQGDEPKTVKANKKEEDTPKKIRLKIPSLATKKELSFSDDEFGRKIFAKHLLNILKQSKDQLVISLTAEWGAGKTTFVRMFEKELRDECVPCVYIDAFQHDYIDDAFYTISLALVERLESDFGAQAREHIDRFKEKVLEALQRVAKDIGIALLKYASSGLLNKKTLGSLEKAFKNIIGDLKNKNVAIMEDKIEEYQNDAKCFKALKEELSRLPKLLTGKDKPLVIIVDELDRCKPTYALELLERIKHFFSVKNVFFILSMSQSQLINSVNNTYGFLEPQDAEIYLQKFIDLHLELPEIVTDGTANDYTKYCERLYDLHELATSRADKNDLIGTIALFSKAKRISLRALDRIFTNIALFLMTTDDISYINTNIICLLAFVRVTDFNEYRKIAGNPELLRSWAIKNSDGGFGKRFRENWSGAHPLLDCLLALHMGREQTNKFVTAPGQPRDSRHKVAAKIRASIPATVRYETVCPEYKKVFDLVSPRFFIKTP